MASDFQMSDVGGLKGDWGLMLRRGLGAKLWGLHQALKLFYFRLDEVDVVRVVLLVFCRRRERRGGNRAVFLGVRCEVGR